MTHHRTSLKQTSLGKAARGGNHVARMILAAAIRAQDEREAREAIHVHAGITFDHDEVRS